MKLDTFLLDTFLRSKPEPLSPEDYIIKEEPSLSLQLKEAMSVNKRAFFDVLYTSTKEKNLFTNIKPKKND